MQESAAAAAATRASPAPVPSVIDQSRVHREQQMSQITVTTNKFPQNSIQSKHEIYGNRKNTRSQG
jgi:hypothetical protein